VVAVSTSIDDVDNGSWIEVLSVLIEDVISEVSDTEGLLIVSIVTVELTDVKVGDSKSIDVSMLVASDIGVSGVSVDASLLVATDVVPGADIANSLVVVGSFEVVVVISCLSWLVALDAVRLSVRVEVSAIVVEVPSKSSLLVVNDATLELDGLASLLVVDVSKVMLEVLVVKSRVSVVVMEVAASGLDVVVPEIVVGLVRVIVEVFD
jgi:hypothetical protein